MGLALPRRDQLFIYCSRRKQCIVGFPKQKCQLPSLLKGPQQARYLAYCSARIGKCVLILPAPKRYILYCISWPLILMESGVVQLLGTKTHRIPTQTKHVLGCCNCWWAQSLAGNLTLVQGAQETFTGSPRTKPSASLILLMIGDIVVMYFCTGAFGYIPSFTKG